eukprot:6994977-Prymnesium_polylepis.1
MPLNYLVSYAGGKASSLLQLDMYALNGRARDGSWVLVVAPPKGKKAAAKKQVVLPPPTPTQPPPSKVQGDGQGQGQGPKRAALRHVEGHAGAAEAAVPAAEAT